MIESCKNDQRRFRGTEGLPGSNQVSNRFLKEISELAGIKKQITFHVSRHTFATNSITLGISVEVVSKLLRHTNIKTTMIYSKVVDSVKIHLWIDGIIVTKPP